MPSLVQLPNLDSVPNMAADTQDYVFNLLGEAREHAQSAVETANATITELRNAAVPETLPEPPEPPTIEGTYAGSITAGFNNIPDLGSITVNLTSGFTPDEITVPNIVDEIPEYVALITGISIPDAPIMVVPTMPVAPSIETDFDLPDAPTATYGDIPALNAIALPDFTAPTLEAFDGDVPVFGADVPSAAIEWSEPSYQARIADSIQTKLATMLAGGTGLDPDVERAIWERDRERIDASAGKAMDEALNTWSGRSFPLPPGPLLAAVRGVFRDTRSKLAELSRDRSIKQADLEQANRQFAIQQGIAFEQMFIQIFLQVTQRNFDIAKAALDARIAIFNAQVSAFNVEGQIFGHKVEKYKVGLQFALAQIEVQKALLEGERIKAEVNKELIAAYKAKIEAYNSQVDAYRALVQAATARSEMQKNKVELYRAQIEGTVAQIGAKKAEFDAYTARVQGEQSKAELEKANSQAYAARVGAITAVSEITLKQSEVQLGISKQKLDYAVAELQRLGELARVQLAAIQARAAAHDVETRRGTAQFEANRSVASVNLQAVIETGRSLIAKYQADVAMWQSRVQQIIEIARVNTSALTAAGQVASNLAAGALAGTNVSAGFSGNVNRGETSNQNQSYTESHGTSTSDSQTYTETHQYNHEV